MAESFFDKRRRERGLTGGSVKSNATKTSDGNETSFFEQRRMERGLIADTRPKPVVPVSKPLTADQFITGSNRAVAGIRDFTKQGEARQAEQKKKKKELPGRDIPVVGSVLRGMDSFADFVKPVSDLGQQFYTPGAGVAPVRAAYGAVQQGISRLLPSVGRGTGLGQRVAREAITETALGAPLTAGNVLAQNPGVSGEEFAKQTALGAGLGGATGAAAPLLGRAISNLFRRNGVPEEQVQEVLSLPMGRADAARMRSVNAPGTEPIVTPYTFGLPEPKVDSPTMGRLSQQVNPYRVQFEELMTTAQQLQKEGKLTPGREDIDLENIWSQMAGREGVSLDELIQRAYPNRSNRVAPDLVQRARGAQAAREVAGAPLPVQSMADRYPQGTMGQAAPLSEMVGRRPQMEVISQAAAPSRPRIDVTPTEKMQPAPVRPDGSPGLQQRGFAETLNASEKTPQGFKDRLQSAYKPITNQETLNTANKRINKDAEEATSFVLGTSRFTAEKATVAQRLIDHYNSQGNYQRSVDIAQKVSEEATRAGQSIQALSMFNRLTPDGVLIHAQRIANKVNEKSSVFSKEAKITPDMAADITGLAKATQKMTGVKDLSNNVIDILERAKAGEKLTDTEAQILKRFVNESKEFVKETTKKPKPPRAPRKPKDKRVRDNLVSFLDAQEAAAKERLRSRGINISSTPLDIWADYAVIGSAKMGRNVVKFADWSEAMVKELGEDIRPHLPNLYERSREAYEASTKKVSQQTIDVAEKLTKKVISTKQLTPVEADSLRALAKKVSGLSGEAKRLASQDLQAILQGLEKPGLLKRISSVQTMGQLLNPKTQVRNSLGNELFYRLERLNKLISTPIDIARSKVTGGERTVTFRTNNQGQYWKNWFRGLQAGWKGVNVNGLETQYDLGSPAFKSKYNPLTYLEKSLGAALKSFDTAAYMRGYNNTLGEMATLRALNEGKRGDKALIQKYIREADDNVMKIADEYGRYVTFQDNNLISQGLVKLKRGLNLGKDFGAGDLIIKYPKTPGALLMRALEYSPAGFLRSAAILARPLMKKEANTAEVTQALTRAIIGTAGLSGMGYFLMDKGVLTGAASKDKDIRGLQQSAGQGQYQVNLSALLRLVKNGFDPSEAKLRVNDYLYTYDWMQPASIAVSIGANVKNNLTKGKDGLSGLAGTAYNSLEGGLGTLTEQSVLSGLKQAAEGYPGQTVTDKIMDILSDIPASFVPTMSNQIKQLQDNARRETYDPSKTKQSLNRAQAKIPGLAGRLPQQYDTLGQPKETYQNNSPLNVLINPGFSSRYKLSPEAKYVVDLIAESGDEKLAPRVPGKTIEVDGVSIELNGDMFARYQQLLGEQNKEQIAKRAERDSGKSLDRRSKNMTKALNTAGDKARKELRKEMGYLK
jgi:hypothetical protein